MTRSSEGYSDMKLCLFTYVILLAPTILAGKTTIPDFNPMLDEQTGTVHPTHKGHGQVMIRIENQGYRSNNKCHVPLQHASNQGKEYI